MERSLLRRRSRQAASSSSKKRWKISLPIARVRSHCDRWTTSRSSLATLSRSASVNERSITATTPPQVSLQLTPDTFSDVGVKRVLRVPPIFCGHNVARTKTVEKRPSSRNKRQRRSFSIVSDRYSFDRCRCSIVRANRDLMEPSYQISTGKIAHEN